MSENTQNFDPHQKMKKITFEVFHYKDSSSSKVGVHHHDFYEIYNLICGEISYWVNGKIYSLKPGDLLLINPMDLHRPIIKPEQNYERIVLWINKSFLESLPRGYGLCQCFRDKSNHLSGWSVSSILIKLSKEEHSNNFGSDIYAYSLLLQLLIEINRLIQNHTGNTEHPPFTVNVLNYIDEHYRDILTLDFLAEKFHVSKYHLSHQFKRKTGTSLYHYITLKRLAAARQQLIEGHSPGKVYASCGFQDYTAFYKAYKTQYGMSPNETFKQFLNQ